MDPVVGLILYIAAFVAIFGGVIAVFVFNWQRANRRREAFAAWALLNGLSYAQADNSLGRFQFDLFSRGKGRGWENVVTGTFQGVEVRLADYWYYEESRSGKGGRTRTYHRFSVAIVPLSAYLPAVRIARESVLSRLADHVGFRDIEFESEEFNRRFDVRADDRQFAFKLLDARMIDWLLRLDGSECYEVQGSWLLAYSAQLPPEQAPSLVAAAKAFLERVPRLVWVDYGKGSP